MKNQIVSTLLVAEKEFVVLKLDTDTGVKFGTKKYNGITMLIEDEISKAVDARIRLEEDKARKPYVEKMIEDMEVNVIYTNDMGLTLSKREDGSINISNLGIELSVCNYKKQEEILLTIKK